MTHMMSWIKRARAKISLIPVPKRVLRALMPNWKLISRSIKIKVRIRRIICMKRGRGDG